MTLNLSIGVLSIVFLLLCWKTRLLQKRVKSGDIPQFKGDPWSVITGGVLGLIALPVMWSFKLGVVGDIWNDPRMLLVFAAHFIAFFWAVGLRISSEK